MAQRPGLIVALVASSGAGKTTTIKELQRLYPEWGGVISVTTRPSRPGEVSGKEYLFVSEERFTAMEENGEFLWTAGIYGGRYGTMRRSIEEALDRPGITLMHLRLSTVQYLIGTAASTNLCLVYLTVSSESLEERLRERDLGKPESYFQERLLGNTQEVQDACDTGYPFKFVENKDGELEVTVAQIEQLVIAKARFRNEHVLVGDH